MPKKIDLTGVKRNKLQVIKLDHIDKRHNKVWLCKCDCGNYTTAKTYQLNNGSKQSCGCAMKENMKKVATKHSLSRSRIYRIYTNMVVRCTNPNDIEYKNYGGRGIRICDEWVDDFMAFNDWSMANGYKKNLTIDRIDNNGNYEPSNCRWIDMKTQQRNRRSNRLITINGIERTLIEWSEISGIDRATIARRINVGWDKKDWLKPVFHNKEFKYVNDLK